MALLTVIPIDLPSLFLFQMSRSFLILSRLLAVPSGCTELDGGPSLTASNWRAGTWVLTPSLVLFLLCYHVGGSGDQCRRCSRPNRSARSQYASGPYLKMLKDAQRTMGSDLWFTEPLVGRRACLGECLEMPGLGG